jgi:hypothetical protein
MSKHYRVSKHYSVSPTGDMRKIKASRDRESKANRDRESKANRDRERAKQVETGREQSK